MQRETYRKLILWLHVLECFHHEQSDPAPSPGSERLRQRHFCFPSRRIPEEGEGPFIIEAKVSKLCDLIAVNQSSALLYSRVASLITYIITHHMLHIHHLPKRFIAVSCGFTGVYVGQRPYGFIVALVHSIGRKRCAIIKSLNWNRNRFTDEGC